MLVVLLLGYVALSAFLVVRGIPPEGPECDFMGELPPGATPVVAGTEEVRWGAFPHRVCTVNGQEFRARDEDGVDVALAIILVTPVVAVVAGLRAAWLVGRRNRPRPSEAVAGFGPSEMPT